MNSARTRWLALALGLVALLGGLAWWLARRAEPDAATPAAEEVPARVRIVAQKQAARARGEVDLRAASVSGRVTGSDGKPIAGALVLLTSKGLGPAAGERRGKAAEPLLARTDAGGSWRVDGVSPGRYTIGASARGYLPGRIGHADIAAGVDNPGFDLQLVAGGVELRGTVSDVGGGPIEDAMIQIMRTDEGNVIDFGRAPAPIVTDEEGHFVATVPTGTFSLGASHPDYVADSKQVVVAGPRTVEFVLTPGASISGVVRALPDGAPVAGAFVVANDDASGGGGFAFGLGARVVTDDGGNFELRGLASGVHGLVATAPKHATAEPVEVALGVAEQVTGVEIWVDRAYTIAGFVVRRGGNDDQALEGVLVGAFSLQPTALFVASAPSAQDGYFEIVGVQPGNYMVGAIGEEALPNLTGTSAIVSDADVTDVLVVMDPGVSVRGRVQPPKPATVSVRIDGESMGLSAILTSIGNALLRTRTSEDGSFTLSPVAGGKLELVATADDGSEGVVPIEVGAQDLDDVVVSLAPRASLSGKVVDAAGKPAAGVTVFARSPEQASRSGGFSIAFNGSTRTGEHEAATAEDGSYVVRGLQPGRYSIAVKDRSTALAWAEPADPAHPDAPIELEIPERGVEGHELRVEARDGSLRGRVVDEQGQPVADAWVTAYREGTNPFSRRALGEPEQRRAELPDDDEVDLSRFFGKESPVLTDEHGAFTVPRLRSGTYTLVAEGERGGARVKKTGLALGSNTELKLESLGVLAGRVEFGGKALEGITVAIEGPTPRSKAVRDAKAAFRFERLDPGHYTVTAQTKQGTAEVEVELEQGRTAEVVLEIEAWGKLRGIVVDGTGNAVAGLGIMAQGNGNNVSATTMMSLFTGGGPKTDDRGRFEIDEVPPGEGTVVFFDRDAIDGARVEARYDVDGGATADLGTITMLVTGKVPPDERGTLGMTTHVATWAKRPRAAGSEDDGTPPPDDGERLWVLAVEQGGPAERAGVEPGDEIVAIDGQQVASQGARTAVPLLSPAAIRSGQSVRLELDRGGSSSSATVVARAKAKHEPRAR
ncbi:MAG: carboxypeptidase regulatory-like domain-containing protein [Nannocystaceae bacterium]|nr:carboxypeptidase regulatory-like domain-containing protein [Nannocystaceae bacterium]